MAVCRQIWIWVSFGTDLVPVERILDDKRISQEPVSDKDVLCTVCTGTYKSTKYGGGGWALRKDRASECLTEEARPAPETLHQVPRRPGGSMDTRVTGRGAGGGAECGRWGRQASGSRRILLPSRLQTASAKSKKKGPREQCGDNDDAICARIRTRVRI